MRQHLLHDRLPALEDKIWRALGTLESARAISSEEAMFLLSHLRLGVVLGRVEHIDLDVINELMIAVQSAHLQKRIGQPLDGEGRSIARADLIRDRLKRLRPSDN
jgi:protein arginine kinase